MTRHLQREIDKLKKRILSLAAEVEESLQMAVRAVTERDPGLVKKVIEADSRIDQEEVDLEEECLKVLALHQPVAIDLRFVVSVLKINNDLERIGDLAVNIAERAALLAKQERIDVPIDFRGMAEQAQSMLRKSLDALVSMDPGLAQAVRVWDDELDTINRKMLAQVQDGIRANPEYIEQLIHHLLIARHLERIADHATNIAEDVIYLTEGEIVRHKYLDYEALFADQ
jgi:phosphate transport system protein